MANEIFYCSRCQCRLFGQQFLEGTAFRVRDQISCENCLGEVVAPLSLEEQQERVIAGLVDVTQNGALPALVVCHRGTIRVALCHTQQRGLDMFSEIDVPNGGLVRL